VVIGRPNAHTPILRTMVQAVIANPPWYIPDDIAIRTILPHLRNTHGYLAAHDISFEQGQFKQAPGPHNGLGVLMLDAPNPFWVYMHDTPSKSLFRLDVREKSNGCVRVEKIFQLASLALTDDAEAGADTLNDAIATGQTQQLELPHSLPAYMLYWTARADENGNVQFHPDRYNRDPPLIAKLGFGVASSSMRVAAARKSKSRLKVQRTSLDLSSTGVQSSAR
jgi:murein L,D-transpeptidase YcbB/YkuD